MKNEILVADFMSAEFVKVTLAQTVYTVVQILKDKNIGAVGVVDQTGNLVGMFSERDVVKKIVAESIDVHKVTMKDVMTSPVISVSDTDTAQKAMVLMNDHRIRHLPVVSEQNKSVGVISIRDVMHAVMQKMIDDFLVHSLTPTKKTAKVKRISVRKKSSAKKAKGKSKKRS